MRNIRHTRRQLHFARVLIRQINETCELHETLLAPALFERYCQLRINMSKIRLQKLLPYFSAYLLG